MEGKLMCRCWSVSEKSGKAKSVDTEPLMSFTLDVFDFC
jgi:hypothetical protein